MTKPADGSKPIHPRVLKMNVGFMLANSVGYSRTAPLDIPDRLQIAEDLVVESLTGEIRLTRTSEGILLQGDLQVVKFEPCTRCYERNIDTTVPVVLEELFATDPTQGTDFFIDEDGTLDLAPLLREETFLALPTQIYCTPERPDIYDRCDHPFKDGIGNTKEERIDPRWAALAQLQQDIADDENG